MKLKTISGHYDKSYNLAHNNRLFLPSNVDPNRICQNYYCVAAGQNADIDLDQPRDLTEYWERYHALCEVYWDDRKIHKNEAWEKYCRERDYWRQRGRVLDELADDPILSLLCLLILPLYIIEKTHVQYHLSMARVEYEHMLANQDLRDRELKESKQSLRDALRAHDLEAGTKYLHMMDELVTEMAKCANDYVHRKPVADLREKEPDRYATLEEIYDKLFEPSFQAFQNQQRPCRRYAGTYLEQIREQNAAATQKQQQTPNAKNRTTAEAIEIVIGIGDMDNTGYLAALEDAKKSEDLLKDYCDHLLYQTNVCIVTTRELADPNWQPPFKHGLIIVNLTVHADEATPGIHLTCIPYSRGCKRGPAVQASLGRAFTGMGYPSTWKDALDQNGEKVPKINKQGEIVRNKDGSIRYKQEPDGQGILDWIEDQKSWIQTEMCKRYDWDREYKGAHPRGNLSTPDYQAARAKERQQQAQRQVDTLLDDYEKRVNDLSTSLDNQVGSFWQQSCNQDLILKYLELCSDEEYEAILEKACHYLDTLADREQAQARQALEEQILLAGEKRNTYPFKTNRTHLNDIDR